MQANPNTRYEVWPEHPADLLHALLRNVSGFVALPYSLRTQRPSRLGALPSLGTIAAPAGYAAIAARVAALAEPGEVRVSRTVKDLVAGSGLYFEDRVIHALKGVPDDRQLFAVSP